MNVIGEDSRRSNIVLGNYILRKHVKFTYSELYIYIPYRALT